MGVVTGRVVVGELVVGVVVLVAPVHVVPFSAKLVGAGLLEVKVPLNPNEAVPLVAIAPFQPALVTVTAAPD